jgi:hypothetical protein
LGIICLTPESIHKPWVLFEAGALAKGLGKGRVCPYLIDMTSDELRQEHGPLSQFQLVEANREGTQRLLLAVNEALGKRRLRDEDLTKYFKVFWRELHNTIQNIGEQPVDSYAVAGHMERLGVVGVFRNREDAMTNFRCYLEYEVAPRHRRAGQASFVCTSMRVFMVGLDFSGRHLLGRLAKTGCKLHIMLTHPEATRQRDKQELWPAGTITADIRRTVTSLLQLGVPEQQIRFYRGSPTMFGIATPEAMLLNPYPHECEGHLCMAIIVRNTGREDDIYHQYLDHHFVEPWEHAVALDEVKEELGLAKLPVGV